MRAHRPASRIKCHAASAALCLVGIFAAHPSQAAEYGLGSYLLGLTIPQAGLTPPPGVYFSDTMYFYEGRAGGNRSLPFGRAIVLEVKEQFLVNVATLSVFTDASFLGGTFGLAGTVPFGRASVSADLSLLGPLGTIGRSDSVTGLGDSAITALLGWHAGFHHWNVSATGVIPTGARPLAFMGLNRPGVDVKGAYTYLNTQTGTEVSGAAGFTFNFINTATDYLTGTEFHLGRRGDPASPVGLFVRCGRLSLPPDHRRQRLGRAAGIVRGARDGGRTGARLCAQGRRPTDQSQRPLVRRVRHAKPDEGQRSVRNAEHAAARLRASVAAEVHQIANTVARLGAKANPGINGSLARGSYGVQISAWHDPNNPPKDGLPVWVILDRDEASSNSRHVGCASESGSKIRLLAAWAVKRKGRRNGRPLVVLFRRLPSMRRS